MRGRQRSDRNHLAQSRLLYATSDAVVAAGQRHLTPAHAPALQTAFGEFTGFKSSNAMQMGSAPQGFHARVARQTSTVSSVDGGGRPILGQCGAWPPTTSLALHIHVCGTPMEPFLRISLVQAAREG